MRAFPVGINPNQYTKMCAYIAFAFEASRDSSGIALPLVIPVTFLINLTCPLFILDLHDIHYSLFRHLLIRFYQATSVAVHVVGNKY